MTLLVAIVATALLSAALTAVTLVLVFRRLLLPELEERLARRSEAVRDDFAQAIERSVRKGVLDGVAAIPSREVLQDTTRTIARTGMEIVGDGLSSLLGRRAARRSEQGDDDDPVT